MRPSTELVRLDMALGERRAELAQLMPAGGRTDQLMRAVLVACARDPKLQACTTESLLECVLDLAALGLTPQFGQGWLLPFGSRGSEPPVARLIVGYKGIVSVAARSGYAIRAGVVQAGDVFEFDEAEGYIKHLPDLARPQRGQVIAAWARAVANRERLPPLAVVLPRARLLEIRAAAPAGRDPKSPWNLTAATFEAMARKSAIRAVFKHLPLGAERERAFDRAVDEELIDGPASTRPRGRAATRWPPVIDVDEIAGVEPPGMYDDLPEDGADPGHDPDDRLR